MADTKISGLAAAASFLSTHELPVNEAGTTKKVTGAQVTAAVARGRLATATVTANQTGITALVDLTGLTVTITAAQSNARAVRVTCQVRAQQNTGAGNILVQIMEGATILGQATLAIAGAGGPAMLNPTVILTPTNASHTYKLQMSTTTNTVDMLASATAPAFIMAEDIGT